MATDTETSRGHQAGASRARDEVQWVAMGEATRLSEKSEATIRRLIERKLVEARKDSNGRYQISRQSLMGHLVTSSPGSSTRTSRSGGVVQRSSPRASTLATPPQDDAVTSALREQIATMKEQMAREQRLSDELRIQVKELEKERTQHLAEMRAMLSSSESKAQSISQWVRSKLK